MHAMLRLHKAHNIYINTIIMHKLLGLLIIQHIKSVHTMKGWGKTRFLQYHDKCFFVFPTNTKMMISPCLTHWLTDNCLRDNTPTTGYSDASWLANVMQIKKMKYLASSYLLHLLMILFRSRLPRVFEYRSCYTIFGYQYEIKLVSFKSLFGDIYH